MAANKYPTEKSARRFPGRYWRVLGEKAGIDIGEAFRQMGDFDEIVICDWFHLERMDYRDWWFCVGDTHFNVHIPRDPSKKIDLMIYEGPLREGRSNPEKENERG